MITEFSSIFSLKGIDDDSKVSDDTVQYRTLVLMADDLPKRACSLTAKKGDAYCPLPPTAHCPLPTHCPHCPLPTTPGCRGVA